MEINKSVKQAALEINKKLKPDIYCVVSLKQARCNSRGVWIRGEPIVYEGAWEQFTRRLSQVAYGKRAYRRNKRIIPIASTLEGGRGGTRWHINACLRCPDGVTIAEYEDMFRKVWATSPWCMQDVFFEKRTGDAVVYSLKEGNHTLLASSLSF